ncbi:uncharacterized protein NPIL_462781 [Nephila pilipes]|uniref:Gustatory receptor n=1 Tax=Nephila pilipes TaxID=299642 RepID=A0A8X6TQM8_NEPPI|nr:uncharacterized protein NPIL_462781 [Nephila pilipes]
MNNRKHSSLYNYAGKVVIPMMEDQREKRDSDLLRQMQPLLTAFLFTGVDFRSQCSNECRINVTCREILIKISLAVIQIITWIFVLVTIYGTIAIVDSTPIKHYISYQFMEILIIFLRSVLYWRRKDILNILKHLSDVYDDIKHKSKNVNKGAISVLIVVFPGVHILGYGLVVLAFIVKGQKKFMYFVLRKFSNIIPLTLPSYVYYLLGIIDFWLFVVNIASLCLFILLVLIVCTTLSHILQDYRKSIKTSGITFEALQRRHIVVMNTVKRVDKCLSFPVFILLGFHITLLFFLVAFFNYQSNWKQKPSEIEIYFYFILISYLIQYFVITTMASKVHEEMQNIKIEVAEISSRPSQLSAVEQILLIAKINSHSNICLTVWGFLNITKNFVFSSLGALLTFGALFKDL